jgi:hypothetical protein
MMPQLVTLRLQQPSGRPVRILVPVLPVLLILLPVVILAVAVAVVACLASRISVLQALDTGRRMVTALPGTRVDVEHGRTAVLVNIR